MNNLYCLRPVDVERRYGDMIPLVEKLIRKFPNGTYSIGGVMAKFARQDWTCWIVTTRPDPESEIQAVIATAAFQDMAGRPNLQVVFVSGHNPNMLVDVLDEFHDLAVKNGIRRIEIIGRHGWAPKLKEIGYDQSLRMYFRELPEPLEDTEVEGSA